MRSYYFELKDEFVEQYGSKYLSIINFPDYSKGVGLKYIILGGKSIHIWTEIDGRIELLTSLETGGFDRTDANMEDFLIVKLRSVPI